MDGMGDKALGSAGKLKIRGCLVQLQDPQMHTFTSAPLCENILCLLSIYKCRAFRAGEYIETYANRKRKKDFVYSRL